MSTTSYAARCSCGRDLGQPQRLRSAANELGRRLSCHGRWSVRQQVRSNGRWVPSLRQQAVDSVSSAVHHGRLWVETFWGRVRVRAWNDWTGVAELSNGRSASYSLDQLQLAVA